MRGRNPAARVTSMNPLRQLQALGQSIWVDDIRRAWLADGTIRRWIEDDGIAGITSNPAIFEKSISQGEEYQASVAQLAAGGAAPAQICEALALEDVRAAADLFAPVHRATGGRDGFVSLEVAPTLADDTTGSLREARRLWQAFARPNAMIKVPATRAGLPVISALLAEGINVNVTLIFGLRRYAEVVEATLAGLEQRVAAGQPVAGIASVASFFISRIDTAVDARLDALGIAEARALRGTAAVASARLARHMFQEWTASARWQALQGRGAVAQRLLWASTSTKDPAYPALKYVEALVGPHTVNTLPRATLDAYREHGKPVLRLDADPASSREVLQSLQALGIELEEVAAVLEREGVQKFVDAFEALQAAVRRQVAGP